MTSITPIQQPVADNLRNAAQIAAAPPGIMDGEAMAAFSIIARLLRHALEQLGEPNLASVQAAEILIRELNGTVESQRNLRDTVAGILHAQVTGIVPPTWNTE